MLICTDILEFMMIYERYVRGRWTTLALLIIIMIFSIGLLSRLLDKPLFRADFDYFFQVTYANPSISSVGDVPFFDVYSIQMYTV